jgi:glycosyl transferase, family 25
MQLSPANTWTRFINLDSSVERRVQTKDNLRFIEPVLGPAQRFTAIEHSPGWKGCTLSHLAVLKEAIDTAPPEIQHLAVFEDDIIWRPSLDVAGILAKPIFSPFDILVLAYPPWLPDVEHWKLLDDDAHMMRLTGGDLAWTTGYIVHRRFWPVLHKRWTETFDELEVDVSWRYLLPKHIFLCYTPVLGNQSQLQSDVKPERRVYTRHMDPNIALVGKSSHDISPLDKLYLPACSVQFAKDNFDYAINLGNNRAVLRDYVASAAKLCRRRWVHNGPRCCFSFNNPTLLLRLSSLGQK